MCVIITRRIELPFFRSSKTLLDVGQREFVRTSRRWRENIDIGFIKSNYYVKYGADGCRTTICVCVSPGVQFKYDQRYFSFERASKREPWSPTAQYFVIAISCASSARGQSNLVSMGFLKYSHIVREQPTLTLKETRTTDYFFFFSSLTFPCDQCFHSNILVTLFACLFIRNLYRRSNTYRLLMFLFLDVTRQLYIYTYIYRLFLSLSLIQYVDSPATFVLIDRNHF